MKNAEDAAHLIKSMQDYYRVRAPVYDASMGYHRPEVLEALQPVIAYLQEHLRDKTVLELACGPCFWTHHVAQTAKTVVATDVNPATLDEARLKPLDWNRITLQMADAYALPEFSQHFDGAFMVDAFCHVPISKRKAFLEELHSRLEPGAMVLICSQLPKKDSWTGQFDEEGNHLQTRTLQHTDHAVEERAQSPQLSAALPRDAQYTIIKNFPTDEEIETLLSAYSNNVIIEKFPDQRDISNIHRYVIRYTLDKR